MPTPTNRTPLRVARGTYSNLNGSVADIQEGEICYATDQDKLYVKEGGSLVAASIGLESSDIGVTVQAYDVDTAKTDVAQTFTAGQRGEVRHSIGSTFSVDMNDANNFHFETNANFTVSATNIAKGQCGSIFIEYGGGHTGSFPSTFKFVGGAAGITLTATANAIDRIDYIVLDDTSGSEVITCNFTANYVA
jgi:hypothetical protein